MHELNICLSLVRLLEKQIAVENHECHLKTIWIEVGELAGIELFALQFSFPIAAANSIAENAVLKIKQVAGCAWCHRCKKNTAIKTLFDSCNKCGYHDFDIVRGKELRVIKVEVE